MYAPVDAGTLYIMSGQLTKPVLLREFLVVTLVGAGAVHNNPPLSESHATRLSRSVLKPSSMPYNGTHSQGIFLEEAASNGWNYISVIMITQHKQSCSKF